MPTPGPLAENFLTRLSSVRQTGSGWQAKCPCRNDDNNPSLSIAEGSDGRVLVTCHRGGGCDVNQICTAVGLKVHELMPPKEERVERKEKLKFVAAYDFTDEHGHLLFQKVRFVNQDGAKTFRQNQTKMENGFILWARRRRFCTIFLEF